MYLAAAFSACCRVCQATGHISSDLMVLKNASTMELSQQFPMPLIEIRMPACAAAPEVDLAVLQPAVGMVNQSRRGVASNQSTAFDFLLSPP